MPGHSIERMSNRLPLMSGAEAVEKLVFGENVKLATRSPLQTSSELTIVSSGRDNGLLYSDRILQTPLFSTPSLDSHTMTSKSRFLSAFLVTTCTAVFVNVVPFFLTHGAYQSDGQEVAGFPYSFHKIGGDCGPTACDTYNFDVGYFATDLVLALVCAVAVGLIAARTGTDRRSVV